jgi:hypothetical protein
MHSFKERNRASNINLTLLIKQRYISKTAHFYNGTFFIGRTHFETVHFYNGTLSIMKS